jgi:hypothetical protein
MPLFDPALSLDRSTVSARGLHAAGTLGTLWLFGAYSTFFVCSSLDSLRP